MHGVPSRTGPLICAPGALITAVGARGVASAELGGEFAPTAQPGDDD